MIPWERHRAALVLTQRWCVAHLDPADPAGCLRSAALRPPEYPEAWTCAPLPPLWPEAAIEARNLLARTLPPASTPAGRILCFLDTDTGMGEGVPASAGFIDDAYLPPWETWFAIIRGVSENAIVLAWIPAVFGELAQNASEVAASESIRWLDETVVLRPVAWVQALSVAEWAAVRATLQEAQTALT